MASIDFSAYFFAFNFPNMPQSQLRWKITIVLIEAWAAKEWVVVLFLLCKNEKCKLLVLHDAPNFCFIAVEPVIPSFGSISYI